MHAWDKKEQDKIVKLMRQKDRIGIKRLYEAYGGPIYGIIFRLIDDKLIAEKVLSDTFIKVYHHIDDFNAEHSSFFTWIMNIARSLTEDHINPDLKKNRIKCTTSIFELIVNKGFSVEVVANFLAISRTACAMRLRSELKTKSIE